MNTLYYVASKVFWLIFQPINFLLLSIFFGSLMLFTRRSGIGRAIVLVSSLVLMVIVFTPVGIHSLNSIESRHERPSLPRHVDGILVLGGGVDWLVSKGRGSIELGNASDRIVQSVLLAKRFPNAKYVYSGHQGRKISNETGNEVKIISLLVGLGIQRDRIKLEPNARNTLENVQLSYDLIQPGPDEKWLVVTSAFHMHRAMKIFEQKQWDVIPWPVDFRSPGSNGHYPFFYDTPTSIQNVNLAFKEWVGSIVNTHLTTSSD